MDFFGEQDRARQQSYLLLTLFLAVMLGFVFVVHSFASVVAYWLGQSASLWSVSRFSIAITGALSGVVLLGCWLRYQDVREGGEQLAVRFGGTEVLCATASKTEKVLLDVVAEMSVAATIPTPSTFCLKQESSINAFVVGSDDDLAIVVSKGALEKLDRDELLGVIGHEFGHLANGDLVHNMRMLVALGGFNALDELGEHVNRIAFRKTTSTIGGAEFGRKEHTYYALPLIFVGVSLRILGSVGVLAGSIVKSSFSRQRELLADASSVQFTRSTFGLASALDSISEYQRGPALHSKYKGELAHICFQVPVSNYSLGRILDTHPPITDRITAIDRHYSVKARKRKARAVGNTKADNRVTQSHVAAPQPVGLSPDIKLLASDPLSCQAMLFALFVSKKPEQVDNYISAISGKYNKPFSDKVKQIHEAHGVEFAQVKPSVIALAASNLGSLKAAQTDSLINNVESLMSAYSDNTLEHFTALQMIRRKLQAGQSDARSVNVVGHPADGQIVEVRPISELSEELALLLSLMIEASGYSGKKIAQEYARVLKCYTSEQYPLRSAQEPGVMDEMGRAFDELVKQPLSQRKAFLQHCSEIMLLDGISMAEEEALLTLFAASLGVPEKQAA